MEAIEFISKCEVSTRLRMTLLAAVVILIIFHTLVITAPITHLITSQLDHYRQISNSLTNLSVALILFYIVVQVQADIYTNINNKRTRNYNKIAREIKDWFNAIECPIFDESVVSSAPAKTQNALQNFTVCGAVDKLMRAHDFAPSERNHVETYCCKVHFELTNYPSELIYGIHFEFENQGLNESLCEYFVSHYGFERHLTSFAVDVEIPKRPEWVFYTRTVVLESDSELSFNCNLTHARHFIELIGHGYEFIYSKEMVSKYIATQSKKCMKVVV